VDETGLPGENHRPVASHWQTLSHNVVSNTPRLECTIVVAMISHSLLNVAVDYMYIFPGETIWRDHRSDKKIDLHCFVNCRRDYLIYNQSPVMRNTKNAGSNYEIKDSLTQARKGYSLTVLRIPLTSLDSAPIVAESHDVCRFCVHWSWKCLKITKIANTFSKNKDTISDT
jgi:hypothetical protein